MTRQELLNAARNTAADVMEQGIGLTDKEFAEIMDRCNNDEDKAVADLTTYFVKCAARTVDGYFT